LKINGSNQSNQVNPYQKQHQKYLQTDKQKHVKVDQLHISDQAKKLQESNDIHPARQERVEQIKAEVESGRYKIEAEKIAKKILSFWDR